MPRVYTRQFGNGLIEAMAWHRPHATLRQKVSVDSRKTDQEVFSSLPLGDIWSDANLVDVYIYIYLRQGSKEKVPNSWELAMMKLDRELGSRGIHV